MWTVCLIVLGGRLIGSAQPNPWVEGPEEERLAYPVYNVVMICNDRHYMQETFAFNIPLMKLTAFFCFPPYLDESRQSLYLKYYHDFLVRMCSLSHQCEWPQHRASPAGEVKTWSVRLDGGKECANER